MMIVVVSSSRSCLVALLACLWLLAAAATNRGMDQHVVDVADPIAFLPRKGQQNKRSLQASTNFRSNCLYDITVYMDILGGSVNSYDQLLFVDSPNTPGGTLTLANGQTAEGGSPTTFQLADGGYTGTVRIDWNTQTCGSQTVDLTAPIDTFGFGPHKRIVCGGGLFTVFLKMRIFNQNPSCLLKEKEVKSTPLFIGTNATNQEEGEEEPCIFQVSKYVDFTYDNYASFKSLAGVHEFTTSPATDCTADKTECDTFQLYQYDDDNNDNKYLATLSSNNTLQCVANHETMAPVVTTMTSPWSSNSNSSAFETGSFRVVTSCDGTEGFPESNIGATYFWWMTVYVLNPTTCTTLKTATTATTTTTTTTASSKQQLVAPAKDNNNVKPFRPSTNVTIVDIDQLVGLATDANKTSSCATNHQQEQSTTSGTNSRQRHVLGSFLILLLQYELLSLSWM